MSAPRSPRPRGTPGESRRNLLGGVPLAAILSIVGLFVVGIVTYAVATGTTSIPGQGTSNGNGSSDDPGVQKTPTPASVVLVPTAPPTDQVAPVPGTLLYVKDGNIWVQTNRTPQQLTKGGRDSMPTFSPDGQTVYFVRNRDADGKWPVDGVLRDYNLDVPSLMSIPTAGGKATRLLDGLVDPPGQLRWSGFIRNPAVSPSGRYIAISTDLPDPTRSDVVIKIWDTQRNRLIDPGLSEVIPLGHQDPAWKPGTDKLVYVRSDRDGAKGTPRLFQYDMSSGKSQAVTGPAYLHPSFSPDGKWIAATKQSPFGTDVVILNAATGAEVTEVTNDGASWAPVWSPAGDQIAYLHVAGELVDLRLVQLEGTGPAWTTKDPINLTENAGLDGVSRPGWFVPADQLPQPTAAPSTPASPSSSP